MTQHDVYLGWAHITKSLPQLNQSVIHKETPAMPGMMASPQATPSSMQMDAPTHRHYGHPDEHPVHLRHRTKSQDPLHKEEDKLVAQWKDIADSMMQGQATPEDQYELKRINQRLQKIQEERRMEATKVLGDEIGRPEDVDHGHDQVPVSQLEGEMPMNEVMSKDIHSDANMVASDSFNRKPSLVNHKDMHGGDSLHAHTRSGYSYIHDHAPKAHNFNDIGRTAPGQVRGIRKDLDSPSFKDFRPKKNRSNRLDTSSNMGRHMLDHHGWDEKALRSFPDPKELASHHNMMHSGMDDSEWITHDHMEKGLLDGQTNAPFAPQGHVFPQGPMGAGPARTGPTTPKFKTPKPKAPKPGGQFSSGGFSPWTKTSPGASQGFGKSFDLDSLVKAIVSLAEPEHRVGFLVDGHHPVCRDCARHHKGHSVVPLHHENVHPYSAQCHDCGSKLVEPRTRHWPELFSRGDCPGCGKLGKALDNLDKAISPNDLAHAAIVGTTAANAAMRFGPNLVDRVKNKKTPKQPPLDKAARLGSGARFKAVERSAAASGARDPAAVAAVAGRKKYGEKKMESLAEHGK